MSSKNKPLSRKDDIVVQELDGEFLIYDLRANKAFCLNETSALIWQACDGSRNIPEISESISQTLNSPANEDLVWLALDQLKKEKLIANSDEIIPDFHGMSRRDVIAKVGLASVIALPFITSLIAPKAIHAASACNTAVAANVAVGGNCPTNCAGATCGAGQPGRTCMTTVGANSVCG